MAEPEASKTTDAATDGATQKPDQKQDDGSKNTDQGTDKGDEFTLDPYTRLAAAISAATEEPSAGDADAKKAAEEAAAKKAADEAAAAKESPEQAAAAKKAAEEAAAKKAAEDAKGEGEDKALEKSWENVIKIEKGSREIKQQMKTRDEEISVLKGQVQQLDGLQSTQKWIEQFQSSPYAALESLGVSYEGWTEFRANGGQSGANQRMDALERRFDEKEEVSQEADKQAAETSQADVQASVQNYAKAVRELMGQEGLDHLNRFGTVQEVMDYVGTHWNETRQVLDPAVAARAYNEYLKGQNPDWKPGQPAVEADKKTAEEAKAAEDAKAAEEAKVTEAKAVEARKAEEEKKGKMTTLTNDMASVADPEKDEDLLDPQKRIQRAIRAVQAGN